MLLFLKIVQEDSYMSKLKVCEVEFEGIASNRQNNMGVFGFLCLFVFLSFVFYQAIKIAENL